ncbi:hypothetical protein LTR95_003042 [Oleoguttula sp. CCFEE 5521]
MPSPRSTEYLDTPAVLSLAQQVNPQGNATSSDILVALRKIYPRMSRVEVFALRERVLSASNGSTEHADEDSTSEDEYSDASDSDVALESGADTDAHAQHFDAQHDHLAAQQTSELVVAPVTESDSAADADAQDLDAIFDNFTQSQTPEPVGEPEDDDESLFGEGDSKKMEVDDLFGEYMSETNGDVDGLFGEPVGEADNDDINSLFDEPTSQVRHSSDSTATSFSTLPTTATISPPPTLHTAANPASRSPLPRQKLSQYLPPSPPAPKERPAATLALPKPRLALPPPSRKSTITTLQSESTLSSVNGRPSSRMITAAAPLPSSVSHAEIPTIQADGHFLMAQNSPARSKSGTLPPISKPRTPAARPAAQQTATPRPSSAVNTPSPKTRKPEPRYRCRYGCPLKGVGQTGPQLRRHMSRAHNLYHPRDQDDLKPCFDGSKGCGRLHLEKDKSHPCIQNNAGSPGKWCSSRSEKSRAQDQICSNVQAPRDPQEIADTFVYADGLSPSNLVLVQFADDEVERQQANKIAIDSWKPTLPGYALPKLESPQKPSLKRSGEDTEDADLPRPKLPRVDSGLSMGPIASPSPAQFPTYVAPHSSQPSSCAPTPVLSCSRPSGHNLAPPRSQASSPPPYSLFAPSSTRINAVHDAPVQSTMRLAHTAHTQQMQSPGYPASVRPSNIQPGPLSNPLPYGMPMQTGVCPIYAPQSQQSRLPDTRYIGQYNNMQPGARVSSTLISQLPGPRHIGQYNNMQPGSLVSNTHIYLPSVHNGMQPAPTFDRQPQRPSGPSQNTASIDDPRPPPANTFGSQMPRTQNSMPSAPRPQPRQLNHFGSTHATTHMAPVGHYVSPYAPIPNGMLPTQMQPARQVQPAQQMQQARQVQAPRPQQGSHAEDPVVVN